MKIDFVLHFGFPGYIAHPMTEQRNTIINIAKASGLNRQKSDAKRAAVLEAQIKKLGMTQERYLEIERIANLSFVYHDGEIIIPARNVGAFLSHVCHTAPRNVCPISYQLVRTAVVVTRPGLRTGKKEPDGEFGRFVKLEESNQRSWQTNPYIADFRATGEMFCDTTMLKIDDLRRMIEWGGKVVGIGAARSQGYGRCEVIEWNAS